MYTWNKDWVYYGESPWGIINKFMFANSIHGSCAAKILGNGRGRVIEVSRLNNIDKGFVSNYDISGGEWLTTAASIEEYGHQLLFHLLKPLMNTITRFYDQNTVCDMLIRTNLYYCPECMKSGHHLMYHQFAFVNKCPIHNTDLICRCPSCGADIPYVLEFRQDIPTYGCKHCGYKLFDTDSFNMAIDSWMNFKSSKSKYRLSNNKNTFFILSNNRDQTILDPQILKYLSSMFSNNNIVLKPKYTILKGYSWKDLDYYNKNMSSNYYEKSKRDFPYYVYLYAYKHLYRHFKKSLGNRRVRNGREFVKCCSARDIIIFHGHEDDIRTSFQENFDLEAVTFFLWRREMECEYLNRYYFDINVSRYVYAHLEPDPYMIDFIEKICAMFPKEIDHDYQFNILVHIVTTLMMKKYNIYQNYVIQCLKVSENILDLAKRIDCISYRDEQYTKEFLLIKECDQSVYNLYFS